MGGVEASDPLVELTLTDSPELPVGEAFAQWESFLSESYVPLAVEPGQERPFHGRIVRGGAMPGFELSTVGGSAQRVRRTRSGIADTDGEFLFVSILTAGFGRMHQDGRIGVVRPGDMVFYDTTRTYHWDLEGSWEQVVARVPLDLLDEHLSIDRAALPTATTIPAGSAGGVVAAFFRDLARIQRSAPADAAVLAGSGVKLVASVIALAGGERPSGQSAQALTREQVLSYMRTNCGDPGLTVDSIAHACLMSRRSLYRLFDEQGEGLSTVLRRMRIERAKSMLALDTQRPAAAIAHASGFASERHFFRAFRVATGMTPGEYRLGATARTDRGAPDRHSA
ncbi:helix-turn-helix domain-containing protein [Nocardia rhizosphaerae]|uniref:Helix-turn-helix domain-containing protein n=1 Tax=Nocardia rhizosphaerae TaxID=1691571 RepID=A0ABV8L2H5_9NOCA